MAKYIIIHDGETIKHIEQIGHDFTVADIVVADSIPECCAPEGQYGMLRYDITEGMVWDYVDTPVDNAPTYEELLEMVNLLEVHGE